MDATMKTFSSLMQLAALGALSAAATSALAVDTSQWKCESCPFEKAGRSGSVQAGAIGVSDDSQKFGDFTGLNKKGAYLDLSGEARYRSDNGVYGRLEANNLGLDTRSIYFDDASSISFRPATVYGLKTVLLSGRLVLHRAHVLRSRKFEA